MNPSFKEKRWTQSDLLHMETKEFNWLSLCLRNGWFNLAGIPRTKKIEFFIDPATQDYVVRYL